MKNEVGIAVATQIYIRGSDYGVCKCMLDDAALAVAFLTLPPPRPSPAADAGASCEGGGKNRCKSDNYCQIRHRTAPSPVGEGWGGGSKHPAARQLTYTNPAALYVNRHHG